VENEGENCRPEKEVQAAVYPYPIKYWKNSLFITTLCHCVHCAKGKKGQRQFTYRLFSLIAGIKTNMLLIVFVGLIAMISSVSGDCVAENMTVTNLTWSQVAINRLT
jgi:hypothetical protein